MGRCLPLLPLACLLASFLALPGAYGQPKLTGNLTSGITCSPGERAIALARTPPALTVCAAPVAAAA
jgi:hypothetical protein